MGKKRVKIEFEDDEGTKFTVSVDGSLSRTKLTKIMNLVEQMNPSENEQIDGVTSSTSFDRVFELIESKFSFGSFSSTDILEVYEDSYNETSSLSTISTYLNRLKTKGFLTRNKFGNTWIYKMQKTPIRPIRH